MTGRERVEPDDPRLAWLWLALAMAAAAALMLWAGRDTTFWSDDVQYFARANDAGVGAPFGFDYLFQPFNGHLQVVGKALYAFLFDTAGTNYFWFRVVEVAFYLVCVALFFELARVRVGPWAALAVSILLLFLGSGWEVMLWAFDIHTLIALAAGLGAVMAIERRVRHADLIACVLLVISVGSIEIGFAFAAGIALWILLTPGARSRLWVFVVPFVLYAAWTVWSHRYNDSQIDATYLSGLATSLPASLSATLASLTGLVDTGGSNPTLVGGRGPELVLAILVLVAFVWRISTGPVRRTTWMFVAVLVTYWFFITLAHRQPDTSRYMLVDGVLLLLIAADLAAPVRISGRRLGLLCALVVVALPLNLVKLSDGRDYLIRQAALSEAQYAALELVRDRVQPNFRPASVGLVLSAKVAPDYGLPAGIYFETTAEIGSLAMSVDELRDAPAEARLAADYTLAGALEPALEPSPRPATNASCETAEGSEAEPATVELAPGGAVIRGETADTQLSLRRFSDTGFALERPRPGEWSRIVLPADAAPDPWYLEVAGEAVACPLDAAQ